MPEKALVEETINVGGVVVEETSTDAPVETPAESQVETPVQEVSNVVAKVERKKVDFTTDIASKALLESIAPLMDDFKIENIVEVLPEIIRHVQTFKNLTGSQKKNMIVSMLKHLVDITDGPGDDELWDPIIKRLLPGMVDMLVKVDQGKLRLNTSPCRSVLGIFSCCRP